MSYIDHARRHGPGGSDKTPPGDWYYATPVAPAPTPGDYLAGAPGNAPFENGAANVALPDATYSPLRWRLVTAGRAELVGAVDGMALGETVVTLPQPFRPATDTAAVISSIDGSRAMTVAISAATGAVVVMSPPESAPSVLPDTAVTPATYGDATHVGQFTVDQQGRLTFAASVAISGAGGGSTDGWTDDTAHTWTYASGSGGGPATFTVAGVDLTATFTKGTRLRLKQGGAYKYFVCTGSSFSTNTTVNLTAGSDYTLASATITDNYYSYQASPQGYPSIFQCVVSPTGFSSAPTTVAFFSVIGAVATFWFAISATTSNATTLTLTLPVAASSQGASVLGPIRITNNGAASATPGRIALAASSTTATLSVDMAGGTWTASNSKSASGQIFYPI